MVQDTTSKAALVVQRFRNARIAVVGDVCLDRYIFGSPSRMSREAPVVVLEWHREYTLPGEASNPALNIASLGGTAYMVGVIGTDAAAEELRTHLEARGAHSSYLVSDPGRRTTEKIRILAEGLWVLPQQQARIDKLDNSPLSTEVQEQLCENLRRLGSQVDAIVLSDYKHGVVNECIIKCAVEVARHNSLLLAVDSQGDLLRFAEFDCVRCNRPEAEAATGRSLESEADFQRELPVILDEVGCRGLVITRDGEGMSLYTHEDGYHYIPAYPVQVADAVGAGDTATSVLTLALVAGEKLPVAAYIANRAAALVVQHVGNACPTPDDLVRMLQR